MRLLGVSVVVVVGFVWMRVVNDDIFQVFYRYIVDVLLQGCLMLP